MVRLLEVARRELFSRNQKAADRWSTFVRQHATGKRKKAPDLSDIESAASAYGLTGQQAIDAFESDLAGVARVQEQETRLSTINQELDGLDHRELDRRIDELSAELKQVQQARSRFNSLSIQAGLITGGLDRLKADSAPRVYTEAAALFTPKEPEQTGIMALEDLPVDGEAAFIGD